MKKTIMMLTTAAIIGCFVSPAPSYAWGFKSALNSVGGWLTGTGNNNGYGAMWTCSNCLGGYTDFPGSPAPRNGGWYRDSHDNRHYMKPQNLTTGRGKNAGSNYGNPFTGATDSNGYIGGYGSGMGSIPSSPN